MLGAIALVLGIVACAGVAAIWLVSSAPGFDMPGWLRIASGWAIPIGGLGAVALGIAARMRRSGAGLAVGGFVLAAAAAIAFVVMIASNPY
jgi:hypothetical protein